MNSNFSIALSVRKSGGSSTACREYAFSLIEVIIAVGVFSVAAVVILALLPSLTRSAADSADALVAQSFADPVEIELSRLADEGGFDALANRVPVMDAPLSDGLTLVAARDGRRLHALAYLPPTASARLPPGDQYFLVEAWRFNELPLRFDPTANVLVLYVRVSWPYQIPSGTTVTPISSRDQVTFLVSLNR